jgi:hypothetical protein
LRLLAKPVQIGDREKPVRFGKAGLVLLVPAVPVARELVDVDRGLLNGHGCLSSGCGSSEAGGRVEGGLGGLDAADAPLVEDLGVVAVGDEVVDRPDRALAIGDPFAVTNPTGMVLIRSRNLVFATSVASYFRLSVGPE